MTAARARIHAGVCGLITEVVATQEEDMRVTLRVESPCEKIRSLGEKLSVVNALEEIHRGTDGASLTAARQTLSGCCSACVTPIGIFKAMQVAAGLALPRDVTVELRRDDI